VDNHVFSQPAGQRGAEAVFGFMQPWLTVQPSGILMRIDPIRTSTSNAGITVTESNAYVQCGVAGFGIIQAPGIAVSQYLNSGALVEILKPYRPAPRPVSVLYPSRTHLAPQVQVFIEWLQERFPQLHPDWLEQYPTLPSRSI
jgi:DNA-binding transcriptional LysR family regulator